MTRFFNVFTFSKTTVLLSLMVLAGIIGMVFVYAKPVVGASTVTVTPWFSPEYASKNGKDTVNNMGQFSFCALAYHWENTGGDKDSASCRVTLVGGNQWTLSTQTRQDANVVCQAVCF